MLHEIIKKERTDQQCNLVPGEEEPQLNLERHETTRRQSLAAQRWPRQVKFDVKIIINYYQRWPRKVKFDVKLIAILEL